MMPKRRILAGLTAVLILALVVIRTAWARAGQRPGRVFVLMVWDGLRPDLVDSQDTPNLVSLAHEGVLFEHHHSIFPTITMVDAAALSTGGFPGATGIFGDSLYLMPVLGAKAAEALPLIGYLMDAPLNVENSRYLATLNGPGAFDGYLLGVEGIAQQVERAGGYVAIVGKAGPTFLFDDQQNHRKADPSNYLFIADDVSTPELSPSELASKPPIKREDLASAASRDRWLLRFVLEKALPAARAASARGRAAMVVFWQHNPDLAQHVAGLGTRAAFDALRQSDANLAKIRGEIARLGLQRATDLMVVSDHGFATVRMGLSLSELLVGAGIKHSQSSNDIVVARNGGEDLVYLSPEAFPTEEARRATLARIVDFAEAQEWCGPIFSQKPAPNDPKNQQNHLGWIPGTFAQDALGLSNSTRSPDLVISFRELPNLDNRGLTGPGNPAFALGLHGQVAVKNVSQPLVRPVPGVVYSDALSFSTGMGIHGAAGARELRNFCAVEGPDFRRHFADPDPSGNADIAPTIRQILNQTTPAGASGRPLEEGLAHGSRPADSPQPRKMTSYLVLQGQEVVTTLYLTQFEGRDYLDDATVSRQSLGGSP
ncbi:MAG TPA: alkaline phosphatase family protein [Candidatus Binataceae bacterium]|nr:alkaline phosphatase family protein [Candidatus Binataceae bacterium]